MERQTQLNIRVSLEEKAQILQAAKASGMRLSEYMRAVALGGMREVQHIQAFEKVNLPDTPPPTTAIGMLTDLADAFTPEAPESQVPLSQLVTKLKAQGMTTPVATREAKKRLGL